MCAAYLFAGAVFYLRGITLPKPNFLIVGAPRCGTTALYEYLRAHPDIYMPDHKEPCFFCPEFHPRYPHAIRTAEAYRRLFERAKGHKRAGEASTWYLFSEGAALRIHDFNPDAKIIIMLRDPCEMLYSMYYHNLQVDAEDLPTFEAALAAEADRKAGRRIPAQTGTPLVLAYRDTARFSGQVQRYFDVFGRENVHVILFDDFRRDVAAVYRKTLEFLGVDQAFQPPAFEVVNDARRVRRRSLYTFFARPPGWYRLLKRFARWSMPAPLFKGMQNGLAEMVAPPLKRPPMNPETRRLLHDELAPDIARLGEMLGRDLSGWCNVSDEQED